MYETRDFGQTWTIRDTYVTRWIIWGQTDALQDIFFYMAMPNKTGPQSVRNWILGAMRGVIVRICGINLGWLFRPKTRKENHACTETNFPLRTAMDQNLFLGCLFIHSTTCDLTIISSRNIGAIYKRHTNDSIIFAAGVHGAVWNKEANNYN